MVLSGSSMAEAVVMLEAFRREPCIIEHGREALRVTVSIGVAELRSGERLSAARRRADQSLYQAKLASRNCLVVADDEPT